MMDPNPQSGGSLDTIYDLDMPGVEQMGINNTKRRTRVNFEEDVKDSSGTIVSSRFKWYARASCQNVNGTTSWLSDVTGDNSAAPGTTKLTWNLQ